MSGKRLDPIHPGEILAEEFLAPLELSANALARALGVPVTRVSEILRGRRGVSADTALRLARFFGTSPDLWLGLQAEYDLRVAERAVGAEIRRRIVPPRVGPAPVRPYAVTGGQMAVEAREPVGSYGGRQQRKSAGGGVAGPGEKARGTRGRSR